jgi:hypothetical protein
MNSMRVLTGLGLTAALAACSSGDITLAPTNISAGGGSGGSGGGTNNPCASYTVDNATRQGTFDGTNCTYDSNFVSDTSPLTVDVRIPFISGVHIFQDSLFVGRDVSSGAGAAPASGTGPKLVIDAGNKIAFTSPNDYVLITRGSQIIADGLSTAPITFTGFTDAVSRTAGPYDVQLWGGIVINGNGFTNNCTDAQRTANDCHVESEGQPSYYGGNDNTGSSGILRYVVVKHTGFEVAPGDELNGVTFNAVGSGTTVENLQVYSLYDDGIEFFGGSVNITNFVAMYVRDDSIDFSDGYTGTINNALIIQSPTDGNRCIEGDNVASTRLAGGASQTPLTVPTIRHMTCIPSNFDVGTHGDSEGPVIRYGARMILADSIIDGGRATAKLALPSNECFELDRDLNNDTSTAAQAGESTMNRTVISCQEAYVSGTADNLVNGDTGLQWIAGAGTAAAYAFNTFNAVITDPANANVRVLQPGTFFSYDENAAAETVTIRDAANAAVNIGAVGNAVTDGYIGAVRSTANWTANWTYGISAGNRGVTPWWE